MKKYSTVLIILLIYLFGLFCYDLARPLDEPLIRKIDQNIASSRNSTTSKQAIDLNSIMEINSLVVGAVMPDSRLYDFKIFGEKLWLNFAKTEKETQRLKVIFLNRRLAEAEVLLENGKTGEGQQMVNQFAKGSEDLMAELKKQDFLRADPALATDIEKAIASQIDLQKSLMITIDTSSPLFPIKARILALEVQMADTQAGKKEILDEQAAEKRAKIIISGKTAQVKHLSDGQIVKKELYIFGQTLEDYEQYNVQKALGAYTWARVWFAQVINGFGK